MFRINKNDEYTAKGTGSRKSCSFMMKAGALGSMGALAYLGFRNMKPVPKQPELEHVVELHRGENYKFEYSCDANVKRYNSFRNIHDWNHRSMIQPLQERCYDGNCYNYRGMQTKTLEGNTCQPWAKHQSKLKDFEYEPFGGMHDNYCRNPSWDWKDLKDEEDLKKMVSNNVFEERGTMYYQANWYKATRTGYINGTYHLNAGGTGTVNSTYKANWEVLDTWTLKVSYPETDWDDEIWKFNN